MTSDSDSGPEPRSILEAIVESSDDAIYSKDSDARVTSWNGSAERLYGYSESEAVGRDIAMIVPPHRRGEERVILERILGGEKIDHYETERLRKDGTLVEVSIAVSPVRNRAGTIVGASVVGRDISELRRREALEREVEKRDFIARAAHELKNPLTTIAGMAQILQASESGLDPKDREMVYGSLIRQSDRANRLITDLLELARVESGQLEIEVTDVDLGKVVRSSIDALSTLEDFSVLNEIEAGARVNADPFRLEEVFVNLLSNSAKYGAASAVITMERGDAIEISVADDGPGVPTELVPKVFDPFTRGGRTEVEGSGLGLSIAKRLCGAMGGDIRYEPNEPTGARFVITVPGPKHS